MTRPIRDRELWAVLRYLRALHELLDWAPNHVVPERQIVLAFRTEFARLNTHGRMWPKVVAPFIPRRDQMTKKLGPVPINSTRS